MARPAFTIRYYPVPSYWAYSNGSTKTALGNKAGFWVSESASGTAPRRKPKGWINPTAYTFTRTEVIGALGSCKTGPAKRNATGSWYTGVVGTVQGDSSTAFDMLNTCTPAISDYDIKQDVDGLRNAALIAVRNKLKTQSVDLGVAYGERKRTMGLVGDTASRIGKSFTYLLRGQTRRAMNELGITSRRSAPRGSNIPNKWLELQYGWNPLLSDVYGACDGLANRNRDDWRVTAKATKTATREYTYSTSSSSPYRRKVVTKVTRSAQARLDVVPSNEVLISLSSLGVLNPLTLGWELLPYSFVVDWFLPVGNWLDSLDAAVGYECRGYSNSLFIKSVSKVTPYPTYTYGSSGWVSEQSWTGAEKRIVYLDRQVSTSIPFPAFPRFKDPRSLGHMANGLALLASAFSKGPRVR